MFAALFGAMTVGAKLEHDRLAVVVCGWMTVLFVFAAVWATFR